MLENFLFDSAGLERKRRNTYLHCHCSAKAGDLVLFLDQFIVYYLFGSWLITTGTLE